MIRGRRRLNSLNMNVSRWLADDARPVYSGTFNAATIDPGVNAVSVAFCLAPVRQKILTVVSSLAMLLALGACDRAGDRTAGQQIDSATAKTKSAAKDLQRGLG
jgi:hypothetical protein